MTELYCPECADKWSGAYNTDHRCVTCGSPLKAEAVDGELERVRAERDALAAHAERLLEAMAQVADYWNGGEGLAAEDAAQHAQDVACDMLESIPADDNLAHLKAQWQADVIDRLLHEDMNSGADGDMLPARMWKLANKLRHQSPEDL